MNRESEKFYSTNHSNDSTIVPQYGVNAFRVKSEESGLG